MPATETSKDHDRLRALERTGLLSEPAPEEFQEICERARARFEIPIAMITLVGEDTVVVMAGTGVDIPPKVPRPRQFCDRTIQSDDVLVIPDATKDPRFVTGPLVQHRPFVRFYAGAPLRYVRDIRLGALCLLDTRPRQFSPEDRADLEKLAEEISTLIVDRAFERIAGSLAH